jgi:hypothetical protein
MREKRYREKRMNSSAVFINENLFFQGYFEME